MTISVQRHINRRWQLVVCLLLWGCMASSAWAYEHAFVQSPMSNIQSPISNVQSTTVQPTYQFRSTSAYPSMTAGSVFSPTVDNPSFGGPARSGARKGGWGDPDDDDDEIGVMPTTPIGEPLVLILFALLFLCFRLAGKSVKQTKPAK